MVGAVNNTWTIDMASISNEYLTELLIALVANTDNGSTQRQEFEKWLDACLEGKTQWGGCEMLKVFIEILKLLTKKHTELCISPSDPRLFDLLNGYAQKNENTFGQFIFKNTKNAPSAVHNMLTHGLNGRKDMRKTAEEYTFHVLELSVLNDDFDGFENCVRWCHDCGYDSERLSNLQEIASFTAGDRIASSSLWDGTVY